MRHESPPQVSRKRDALCCRLHTDGAARGNPGEAGAGIILYDADNRELAGRSCYLGRCTNNVAEYRALILGLETAREMGCSELRIFLDSELVVRQIRGTYRVKSADLKPLHARAMELLAGFHRWRIHHVARSENRCADALANQGIDEKKTAAGGCNPGYNTV